MPKIPSSPSKPKKSKSNDPKPEPSSVRILVKHPFSDKEIADLARQNSSNSLRLGELEMQLSSVKKDYASKIETVSTEMSRLFNLISSGFEMVEENALVVFYPKEKIKKFYSRPVPFKEGEVGEFIREEPMQPSDFQKPLPLAEEKEPDSGNQQAKPFEPTVLSDEEARRLEQETEGSE